MNTVKSTASSPRDMGIVLEFNKNLNHVTNKVHAASNVDEIILEVSKDICALFNADRLTIYVVGEDNASLVSKIKTGLKSFKDLKLPIAEQSLAGYAAVHKKMLNIKDVYDTKELAEVSPHLRFLQEVDKRTGYRTKQMLVAPILDASNNSLVGVIQVINNKSGVPFSSMVEEGLQELAEGIAVALRQRQQTSAIKTKYDFLVSNAVLTAAEFDLATRAARRKNIDLEAVLIQDFQVSINALGAALANFFGVVYEPFSEDRIKPAELLKNLKREYIESSHWIPIDETQEGLIILTTDPERIQASRVVNNIFSRHRLVYRVCTQREFKQTLDAFYGAGSASVAEVSDNSALDDTTSVQDLVSDLSEQDVTDEESGGGGVDEASAASDNELVKLVNKIIVDAYRMGASDIHIEPGPGKAKTQIRLRKDGSLAVTSKFPPVIAMR